MSNKSMVPPTSSGEKNLPEDGVYKARCIQIIHEGTITEKFQDKEKKTNLVRFVWELLDCYDPETDEYPIFNEEKGPQPYTITQKYNYVLNERSNLFKLIERWTKASKPSKEDLLAYDISTLLGKPCNLTIEQAVSKAGKTYVELVLVSSPVKPKPGEEGYIKPQNELVLFDIDNFDEEEFQKLWPWIQKEIATSDEFKEQFPNRTIADNKGNAPAKSKKPVPPTDFDDDDEEEEEETRKPAKKKPTPPPPAKPASKSKKVIEDVEEEDEGSEEDWAF